MNAISAFAPSSSLDPRRTLPSLPVDAEAVLYSPAIPQGLIATWRRRIGLRRDLRRLSETPWLIDDVGLTMAQVRAEIEKPFWRR